ncbi:TonB-dependent receptor [Aliiglaciecola sp. LCG003]|uniref:TonB-dependent receptor n=1 Tax=Aliiglaciecola sp. LCG003 TaxID=3053655 RepID=UPI0025730F63|nr:TonB-dependent receptor [Aliiglaciecola sp. LCG003]WJG09518.1 TonB-dependent receptor [Aliiglaciecola sp. LCG003]
MKKLFAYLAFISYFLSVSCSAEKESGDFNWHGFIAQGVIQAKHTNYIEDDGDVSLKLSELGLNASYNISSRLRVAGQAVYLSGGNRYPEGARIDYLFLDWKVVNSLDWQLDLYLGRVKNYHWYYSATRDVPHTRPTIILPQSVYFDAFRDIALGVDGVAIAAATSNRYGDWDINWSYGKSTISNEQTKNLVGDASTGDTEQDFVHQLNAVWQNQSLRLGVGLLDSKFKYNKGPQDPLFDGNAQVQRLMLQGSYETQNWQFAGELFRERLIYQNLVFPGFFENSTSEGGYAQARYSVNKDIMLTARLDMFDLNRKDRDGKKRQMLSGGLVPAYFGYQDQVTLGASFNLAEDWRILAEFHRVKGAGRLAPVLQPNTLLNDRKYWNIWGIQLMYWF